MLSPERGPAQARLPWGRERGSTSLAPTHARNPAYLAPVVAENSLPRCAVRAPAVQADGHRFPHTLIALVFSLSAGCAGGCILPSALRWKLFALFGAPKICPEMLKRSVAIRLQNGAPSMGRFFPMTCSYSVDDDKETVTVNVGGTGYGYLLPATYRLLAHRRRRISRRLHPRRRRHLPLGQAQPRRRRACASSSLRWRTRSSIPRPTCCLLAASRAS